MVIRIIIFLLILLFANLSFAGDIIKIYDQQHHVIGYSKIENGKETHFDRAWNRIGHSVYDSDKDRKTHYDTNYNRSGRSEYENDTWRHYNQDNSRSGYSILKDGKETLYDKNWRREGYKK